MGTVIIRDDDGNVINTIVADAAFAEQIAPGRWELVPDAPAAPVVPTSVTMRQARLALLAIGKLGNVATAITAMPSPQREAAQIEWEYSATVERNRPLIKALAPALGLTDAQLDQLFISAAAL